MGYLQRVHDVTLHFVSKCTGLKSVKPGMSSHFSESRDPSYVGSVMLIDKSSDLNFCDRLWSEH